MATGKISEEAINVAAEAAEFVAEESAQVADATRRLNPKDLSLFGSGLVLGLVGGMSLGYWLLNQRFKTKYELLASEEIAKMREYYLAKEFRKDGPDKKPDLKDVVKDLGYKHPGPTPYDKIVPDKSVVEVVPEPETENVFERPQPEVVDPGWDYAVETKQRRPDVPYTIHRDEWVEGKEDHEQRQMTYFEGDDVICDEQDNVVEDQDAVVGLGNLARFGHGSRDPEKVYVRNEEMKIDIEVIHTDAKYAMVVHGFTDDELQHSDVRFKPPRRFDDGSQS